MKQEDLYNLYTEQGDLWKQKELLEINFISIMRQREDILMEKSIIESDLLQEVGFTKEEFDARHHILFLREVDLDNEEHHTANKLQEIDDILASIFYDLSQKLSMKVA